jgi:hypothetical protein
MRRSPFVADQYLQIYSQVMERIQARDSHNVFLLSSFSSFNRNWAMSIRFSETALHSIKMCYRFSVCDVLPDGRTGRHPDAPNVTGA